MAITTERERANSFGILTLLGVGKDSRPVKSFATSVSTGYPSVGGLVCDSV